MSRFYRSLTPEENQELSEKVLKNPYGPIEFKGRVIRMLGTNSDKRHKRKRK